MTDTEMLERLIKMFWYSNFDRKGETPQFVLQSILGDQGVGIWDHDPKLEVALLERFWNEMIFEKEPNAKES